MDNQLMSVSVEWPKSSAGNAAAVVKISGELGVNSMIAENVRLADVEGDTLLDRQLSASLPKSPPLVVIDLTQATYLSSLGIGALLRFKSRLEKSGTEVRLACVGEIETLLRRSRLEVIFTLYPDVSAALAG